MTRSLWLRSWGGACLRAIDGLLFPHACAVCGTWETSEPFCPDCREEILGSGLSMCPRCALPLGPGSGVRERVDCSECRGRRLGFDEAVALGAYQGPIRHLCLRLKHVHHAWLARWLADLLVKARGEVLRGFGADAVAPVPLHWRRRWRRRYNQAEALAGYIATSLGLTLIRPLRRVRPTRTLAGRGRAERAAEMKDAFRARERQGLGGRRVILVDDVLTTGATCGAAARALKQAGAGRVLVAVVGRAEGRS